jgi:hypothetical protein
MSVVPKWGQGPATCGHPDLPTYARSMCRSCYGRWYRKDQQNVAKIREYKRVSTARRRAADPVRASYLSRQHWLRQYGLTVEQWEDMWTSQGGRCAICSDPLERGRNTHLDHDHRQGRIRGLLCRDCNRALGLFRDDRARVQAASEYLRHHDAVVK